MKMDLCDDLQGQANQAINPSARAITYMRNVWLKKENGRLNSLSMYEALKKYGEDNPEITLEIEHGADRLCCFNNPFHEKSTQATERG